MIPDNYDLWARHDAEQEEALNKLPKCKICGEPIQQEDAVCICGNWYCDDCLDDCRKAVEDIVQ